ncbi:MAG: S41 family peptidase, partial [Planctomycetota bacterium]
ADHKELSEFLRLQKKRWLSDPDLVEEAKEIGFEKLFATGIVESIPGGAELVAAKQVKVNESLAANRYVGVGIQLSMQDRPLVTKVFYGGSGRKAGMQDGDMILEIDDLTTEGQSIAKVVERLRGPEGSKVKMKLKQPGAKPRIVDVVRSVTFIPTVLGWGANDKGEQQFFFPNDRSIAYLRIERIGPSTVHELKQAEKILRKNKLKCVLLDLRMGGGRLHDAIMVGDLFLDEGTLGYTQYRDRKTEHVSLPGKLFPDTPTVALIGPEMGADRVLLAAAFQDSGEITLAGNTINNPAYVRKQFSLPSGASVIFPVGILRRSTGDMLCVPKVASTLPAPQASDLKPDYLWSPITKQQSPNPEEFRQALWPVLLKTILAEQQNSKNDKRS